MIEIITREVGMIGYIKGTIEGILSDHILLENHGIGYEIYTSGMVLNQLKMSLEQKMYTYLHVREDGVTLFGFPTTEELRTFKLLMSVSGIGPKAALSILSTLSVQDLALAVMSGDTKTITKANGIGAKGAARLVMELKDKLQIDDVFGMDSVSDTTAGMEPVTNVDGVHDTVLALVSLGYSDTDAWKAVKSVPGAENMDSEMLLKAALKKVL